MYCAKYFFYVLGKAFLDLILARRFDLCQQYRNIAITAIASWPGISLVALGIVLDGRKGVG
jgi:hypothetical protein